MSIQTPEDDGWDIPEEWVSIEAYHTGIGASPNIIEEELLVGVQSLADDLGLDYEPDEEDYEVFFDEDESKAILYGKSWGEAPKIIAEITAYSCDRKTDGRGPYDGRQIRIGNNSDIEINEGVLRGAAAYEEDKRVEEAKQEN